MQVCMCMYMDIYVYMYIQTNSLYHSYATSIAKLYHLCMPSWTAMHNFLHKVMSHVPFLSYVSYGRYVNCESQASMDDSGHIHPSLCSFKPPSLFGPRYPYPRLTGGFFGLCCIPDQYLEFYSFSSLPTQAGNLHTCEFVNHRTVKGDIRVKKKNPYPTHKICKNGRGICRTSFRPWTNCIKWLTKRKCDKQI